MTSNRDTCSYRNNLLNILKVISFYERNTNFQMFKACIIYLQDNKLKHFPKATFTYTFLKNMGSILSINKSVIMHIIYKSLSSACT